MSKVRKWVTLDQKTHDRIKKHGTMGDTFDVVINRVLDIAEGKQTPPTR